MITEIRPLYSQPFTKSHFHFLIILQSVTCCVASSVRTALQVCLFEQSNGVHASSPVNRLFQSWQNYKLVPIWGKCISMFGEYYDKCWYFGEINDLHWKLWWLVIGAKELWSLIDCTFLIDSKKHLSVAVQKLWKHKKQHKFPI